MSPALRVALLLALWLLAWGEITLANVVSGLVLIGFLFAAFPSPRRAGHVRLRPLAALRLGGYILGQLLTSNILVAREIVSRRSRVKTGVLAYDVQHSSDELITLMANIVALTPGTMTVEATREPAVLQVHFLLLHDVEQARASMARLEQLVAATLGLVATGRRT
ncbi:MAG: Na+/H+ antiporter subunit E [Acidimicrobiales bacterium]